MQITLKDKERQKAFDAISDGDFSRKLDEGEYSCISFGLEIYFGEPDNSKDCFNRYIAHLYYDEFDQSREEIIKNSNMK